MKSKFKIKGLDCANCANQLESVIQKIEGVNSATISFMTQRMEVEYEQERKEEVLQKIKKVIKREEPDVTIEEM